MHEENKRMQIGAGFKQCVVLFVDMRSNAKAPQNVA